LRKIVASPDTELTTKEEVIAQTRIEIFHENWLLGFVAALSYSGHQEMKFSG